MLKDLLGRVTPPVGHRPSPAWDIVEGALGTSLPADYKGLVQAYGPGVWDGFLHVFQPSSSNRHLDLVTQVRRRAEVYGQLHRGGEQFPVPVRELMAAGATDNGDTVFWHRQPGGRPEEWPILVNEARGPGWVSYPGPLSGFLVEVLSGAFRCEIFPDDFPGPEPRFTPYT